MNHVDKPQIAVLISVCNGATTLKKCLQSVGMQTLRPISIVFVDDQSTDASLEIVEEAKRMFPHLPFTIIKNQRNMGLTKSLNKGLALINAPYTARIDADDWWHPQKLARQLAFLISHPEYGVVGCNYINHRAYGERIIHLPETDNVIRGNMIRKNPLAHSCVVFKTKIIQDIGGYDESILYAQDYDLWLRCLPHTKFYNLQEILCHRTVGQSISTAKQKQQMWQVLKTQRKYIQTYHFPWFYYTYGFEPLLNVVVPVFIKNIIRRLKP